MPWDIIARLGPYIRRAERASLDEFTAAIAARVKPEPVIVGELPPDPRFVLMANHYERKGLWVAHIASVLTQMVRRKYGPGDPPVSWVVTANWPPLRIGSWRIPSPGDWLLPRVAKALSCYPVVTAGSDPAMSARTLRRLLRDARSMHRPIGLFPEGVSGTADRLAEPRPGVDRLLALLAREGWPVLPVGVSEKDRRFVIRVGEVVTCAELLSADDAAACAFERVRRLATM